MSHNIHCSHTSNKHGIHTLRSRFRYAASAWGTNAHLPTHAQVATCALAATCATRSDPQRTTHSVTTTHERARFSTRAGCNVRAGCNLRNQVRPAANDSFGHHHARTRTFQHTRKLQRARWLQPARPARPTPSPQTQQPGGATARTGPPLRGRALNSAHPRRRLRTPDPLECRRTSRAPPRCSDRIRRFRFCRAIPGCPEAG